MSHAEMSHSEADEMGLGREDAAVRIALLAANLPVFYTLYLLLSVDVAGHPTRRAVKPL
jgi:hypothetical protein